jgi:hypothetical protein
MRSRLDFLAELPNYDGIDWVKTHFKEFGELHTTYYDYVTWRNDDYSGETINIVDGLRVSSEPSHLEKIKGEFWFFGGSATWGTGVKDEGTYPSIFARIANARVRNFGEGGYIARQAFAQLANEYILNSSRSMSRTIVFYNGANDVGHRCRSMVTGLASSREKIIQTQVGQSRGSIWGFDRTFSQLQDFLVKILKKLDSESFYNCDTNLEKAEMIAKSLISTWQQAQNLAEANGDKFLAILQPVAFIGNPNIKHIDLNDSNTIALSRQFDVLYPIMKKEARQREINFIDLTNAYDSEEYFYTDYFHVSQNAHEILVPKIIDGMKINGLY